MQRPVKDKSIRGPGKGFWGNPQAHSKAGKKGGRATNEEIKNRRKKQQVVTKKLII